MAITPKTRFLLYSRPLFRTCEIVCNHTARILDGGRIFSELDGKVSELNALRARYQRILNRIGKSHGHVCAECKGECCGGQRDRDAFLDRILQNPATPLREARNKRPSSDYVAAGCNPGSHGHCAELTSTGCKIPYDQRPIQCTAYFCSPCIDVLSDKECEIGTKALGALMGIQMKSVRLAWKKRMGRS
jgi:hypothetical protein